jgi:hypothetical protein
MSEPQLFLIAPLELRTAIQPSTLRLKLESDMRKTFGKFEVELAVSALLGYSRNAGQWLSVSWLQLATPFGWPPVPDEPLRGCQPDARSGPLSASVHYTDSAWQTEMTLELRYLQYGVSSLRSAGLVNRRREYVVVGKNALLLDFISPTEELIEKLIERQYENSVGTTD